MGLTISHGILENDSLVYFNLYRGIIATLSEVVEKPEYLYLNNYDPTNWKQINSLTDYFGYWKTEPKDPVWFLLAHSDTAGFIKSEHAKLLSERLANFTDSIKEMYPPDLLKMHKTFIKGLSLAAKNNEEVIFKQE